MFTAATLALMVSMALALARALVGPTLYDRIHAVNTAGRTFSTLHLHMH